MKISINWIKEYAGEIALPVEEIARNIKEKLAEVENIEDLTKKYNGIVVAEIVEKKDHPNADKLGVYIVNDGKRKDIQVVAGDKKLEVGNKVVYLPPNTKIPNNPYPEKFDGIIKTTKLRGVDSEGMLASEKELGISNNHENVLILDMDCKVGDSIAEILELNDCVLEIENKALTNRADTFGIIGMARELSGMLKKPFETPKWLEQSTEFKPKAPADEILPIKVENKLDTLCPRYMAITMTNVKVSKSPLWLKSKLSLLGIKPINNVVDITNYLMILTGQPLHAFDYDKLISKDEHSKNKALVTIRTARQGEKITTLDEKTLELPEKTVVICDSQNPIAIGGIMGGLDTEIDQNSKNIIIESANFDLYNIRQTSMKLGLFTEAATRFSKGQDPNLCEPVLYKAVELLTQLCGAQVASSIQDEYTELPKPRQLTFSITKLNKHLGIQLEKKEILELLNNINLHEKDSNEEDLITLTIPTYRQDLQIPEDIHEEVARLYGYKNILITLPKRDISAPKKNEFFEFSKKVRRNLTSMGANEILTYNFVGEELYKKCNLDIEKMYKIINPISPKLEYMRSSLIPSLLEKVNTNINNGYTEFAIYEINKTHNKLDFDKEEQLPIENNMLSMLFTKDISDTYYHAKFYLENLLNKLNIKEVSYEKISDIKKSDLSNQIQITLPLFDINRSALITLTLDGKKQYLGILGEPNLEVQANLKLIQPVSIFELDMKILQLFCDTRKGLINFSKYPKITQDLCFLLHPEVPYSLLTNTIKETLEKRELNYKLTPVDTYQKTAEEKQITIRVVIQHKEKTLKEKDIHSLRKIIEKNVKKYTKGILKS
jgi:phenylalanyl-tRNA synthetase beta chain